MKFTSSKRRKHLYLYAYRIQHWLHSMWNNTQVLLQEEKYWKCLLLKYLYFLGPKGPLCLFSLMHISIIVTSSKQRNTAAASLLFSLFFCRVLLSQAVKTAAPGSIRIPWALGAEGPRACYGDVLRGVVGKRRAAHLNMTAIDKCKADSGWIELAHLGI